MKKKLLFFIKLLLLAALCFGFCFGMVMPQYGGNYQASLLDKVERLKSLEGPRIVLVGNSNLVYGIDSAMIEEQLGMPVVNMGLHGGVGNAFNEQAAKLDVREGDIYVVCQTNYDDEDVIKNPVLAWITIENHFELYPMIRKEDWPEMIKAYPTYLKKCLTLWRTESGNQETDDSYRRSAFNEYGDNYYPRQGGEPGTIDFSPVRIYHINESTANRLNALNSYLGERGATMLVAAYPIANYEKAPKAEEYFEMGQELSDALDCPVISDFRDYMYDVAYFYDTHAHLTSDGARMRTQQLIEDIKGYMDGEQIYK
nr:hypothetical protein [Lachnospiraceae bacterium]